MKTYSYKFLLAMLRFGIIMLQSLTWISLISSVFIKELLLSIWSGSNFSKKKTCTHVWCMLKDFLYVPYVCICISMSKILVLALPQLEIAHIDWRAVLKLPTDFFSLFVLMKHSQRMSSWIVQLNVCI